MPFTSLLLFVLLSTIAYIAAWSLLLRSMRAHKTVNTRPFYTCLWVAISAHALWCFGIFDTAQGYQFGFFQVASLFLLVMNTVVALSGLKKPVKNLFILLIPLTLIAFAVGKIFDDQNTNPTHMTAETLSHVLLSILAYSLLTIATLQSLVLNYQYQKLKSKHPGGVLGILPPLQTMEKLMFELVWVGFILLSLSIVSGLIFIEDMFAQKLAHKTLFSLISWLIYAVILWGRFRSGWRGITAIRWLMLGFVALMLAYFGSKLVLEVILS